MIAPRVPAVARLAALVLLTSAGCGTPVTGPSGADSLGPNAPASLGPSAPSAPASLGPTRPSVSVPGPVTSAVAAAPAPASRLRCGALDATARPVGSDLRLRAAGRTFVLRPVPAASGARYQADGDPGTWLWNRGDRAMLSVLGRTYPECTVAAEGAPPPLVARGNEPAWELVLTGTRLRFTADEGRTRFETSVAAAVVAAGGRRYESQVAGALLRVDVRDTGCVDAMSGMPFPAAVAVIHGGRRWSGCGGEPASLLRGAEWVVEDIDSAGIIDRSHLTVAFGPDGRLEGRAGCNPYVGRWRLTGEALHLTEVVAAARTCAPALMHQEARFLARLREVHRFEIDRTGALRLHTPDRPGILARRG